MKKHQIKILDRLFSKAVRTRDNFRCYSCGDGYPQIPKAKLDCAHIIGKAQGQVTRWLMQNAITLCRTCHIFFTANPKEWKRFIINRVLNEEAFLELEVISKGVFNDSFETTKTLLQIEIAHYTIWNNANV